MEKATGWLSPASTGCAILAGIMIKQMPKVELGKTGETVSRFSLGCMYMGTSLTREASYAALEIELSAAQLATLDRAGL